MEGEAPDEELLDVGDADADADAEEAPPREKAAAGGGGRKGRERKRQGPSKTCHRCGSAVSKTPEKETYVCTAVVGPNNKLCNTSYHCHDCRLFFQKAFEATGRPDLDPATGAVMSCCTKCLGLCWCKKGPVACSAAIQTEAHRRKRVQGAAEEGEEDGEGDGEDGEEEDEDAAAQEPRAKAPSARKARRGGDGGSLYPADKPVIGVGVPGGMPAPLSEAEAAAAAAALTGADVQSLEASCLEAVKAFTGTPKDVHRLRGLAQQLSAAHRHMLENPREEGDM